MTMNDHCQFCPIAAGSSCPAEEAPSLCRRVDPGDPDHRPGWADALVLHAAQRNPDAFPSLAQQAANLVGAVGRVVAAVASGEPVRAPLPVYYERLAICRECEHNAEAPAGVKCKLCGCGGAKLQLATEACPLAPPKWNRWTEEPKHADHGR